MLGQRVRWRWRGLKGVSYLSDPARYQEGGLATLAQLAGGLTPAGGQPEFALASDVAQAVAGCNPARAPAPFCCARIASHETHHPLSAARAGAIGHDGGDGPVCQPGMGDARPVPRCGCLLLAAGWRVITVDARGQGESSIFWQDYSAQACARDALALLDALGIAARC